MSQPTHEPPDPELWGRVVEIWRKHCVGDIHVTPPPEEGFVKWRVAFWVSRGDDDGCEFFRGKGPTMNDAARALIAEWEGRR